MLLIIPIKILLKSKFKTFFYILLTLEMFFTLNIS